MFPIDIKQTEVHSIIWQMDLMTLCHFVDMLMNTRSVHAAADNNIYINHTCLLKSN